MSNQDNHDSAPAGSKGVRGWLGVVGTAASGSATAIAAAQGDVPVAVVGVVGMAFGVLLFVIVGVLARPTPGPNRLLLWLANGLAVFVVLYVIAIAIALFPSVVGSVNHTFGGGNDGTDSPGQSNGPSSPSTSEDQEDGDGLADVSDDNEINPRLEPIADPEQTRSGPTIVVDAMRVFERRTSTWVVGLGGSTFPNCDDLETALGEALRVLEGGQRQSAEACRDLIRQWRAVAAAAQTGDGAEIKAQLEQLTNATIAFQAASSSIPGLEELDDSMLVLKRAVAKAIGG